MTTETKAAGCEHTKAADENVLPGRKKFTTRRPLGVSIHTRPRYAPDLVSLHVGDGWAEALAAVLHELERYGAAEPTLILPEGHDPAAYRWPVAGRNVVIYGASPLPLLRRLLAALRRDGAAVVAGIDTDGQLHTATARIAREAA